MLSPGFSIAYLNGLEPIMQACCQMFEETIDEKIAAGHGATLFDIDNGFNNLATVPSHYHYPHTRKALEKLADIR